MGEKQVVELKQVVGRDPELDIPWGALVGMWRGHGDRRQPDASWEHLGEIPFKHAVDRGWYIYPWKVYRGEDPEGDRSERFLMISKFPRITVHRGGSRYEFTRDRDTGVFLPTGEYGPLWHEWPELWHCFEHLLVEQILAETGPNR